MKTQVCTVSAEASGNSHRTNGSIIREECWTDLVSPEAETITVAQSSTGNQYLANNFKRDTAHKKPGRAALGNVKDHGARVAGDWRLTLATNLSLLDGVRLNPC